MKHNEYSSAGPSAWRDQTVKKVLEAAFKARATADIYVLVDRRKAPHVFECRQGEATPPPDGDEGSEKKREEFVAAVIETRVALLRT